MSDIRVKKFGGSSFTSLAHMQHIAHHVAQKARMGKMYVVVVSALQSVTRTLSQDMHTFPLSKPTWDHDTVLASGEQVSAGLFSLALQSLGIRARAWLGWQLPIHTLGPVGNSDIASINVHPLRDFLTPGSVAVVAGFQGINAENRITTLGFEGSDTTAVALAQALNAPCTLYKDVPGIYPLDPKLWPGLRSYPHLSYDQMLTLCDLGAQVIHPKAVRYAKDHSVPLHIHQSAPQFDLCTRITDQSALPFWGGTLTQGTWTVCDALTADASFHTLHQPGTFLPDTGDTPSSTAKQAVMITLFTPHVTLHQTWITHQMHQGHIWGWRWHAATKALQWVADRQKFSHTLSHWDKHIHERTHV